MGHFKNSCKNTTMMVRSKVWCHDCFVTKIKKKWVSTFYSLFNGITIRMHIRHEATLGMKMKGKITVQVKFPLDTCMKLRGILLSKGELCCLGLLYVCARYCQHTSTCIFKKKTKMELFSKLKISHTKVKHLNVVVPLYIQLIAPTGVTMKSNPAEYWLGVKFLRRKLTQGQYSKISSVFFVQ